VNRQRILLADARLARAWRNGGGTTSDVAVFPHGAGDDDFYWRASIATIAAEGPFSIWPGVERTLMLLRGRVTLQIGDRELRLETGDTAIVFAGEENVAARPEGEACTVLNIMTRRGHIQARLERWMTARPSAAGSLLMLAEQPMAVRFYGETANLAKDDALLLAAAAATELQFDHPLIVAELFA